MNEITLDAMERSSGRFKESGYIPGILYGDGIDAATAVKFDEKSLNRLLSGYGNSAKLWINLNGSKKFGFIKEVHRKHLTRNVTHVDVQIVSQDHEIKMLIPINYIGEDILKTKQLKFQIYKEDVTVFGKMALMPDAINVDVTEMKLGDNVTKNTLNLNELLKIENEDALFGQVINLRALPSEAAEPAAK